ncbi:transporter substrate-binding domain-containing protein [Oceanospirillum sp. HFRX-1_2]
MLNSSFRAIRVLSRADRFLRKAFLRLLPTFFLIVGLMSAAQVQADQVLRVGMPKPGVVPFFWQDSQGAFRGIYADTLRLIANRLEDELKEPVSLKFIPLSQARLLRQFEAGEIDIEAGVVPALPDPGADPSSRLAGLSLFTQPYGVVNNVIIYQPELSFPIFILPDLKGQLVATVRGSQVPPGLIREDFSNQWQIAQRVHRKWNEIGLMTEAVALYYQHSEKLDYKISLPYVSNSVSFRLHLQHKALLDPINRVIDQLDEEGKLERLVCDYLCGKAPASP